MKITEKHRVKIIDAPPKQDVKETVQFNVIAIPTDEGGMTLKISETEYRRLMNVRKPK